MTGWLKLFLILLAPFLIVMFLFRDHCTHEIVEQALSPSGELEVRVVRTVCKASKPAVEIFLGKPREGKLADAASVLLYQGDPSPSSVKWTSDTSVTLAVPPDAPVVKHRPEWLGVTFTRE